MWWTGDGSNRGDGLANPELRVEVEAVISSIPFLMSKSWALGRWLCATFLWEWGGGILILGLLVEGLCTFKVSVKWCLLGQANLKGNLAAQVIFLRGTVNLFFNTTSYCIPGGAAFWMRGKNRQWPLVNTEDPPDSSWELWCRPG